MRKFVTASLVFLATAFVFFGLHSIEANAQRGRKVKANKITKVQVDRVIKNVEQRVDRFTSQIDDSLDNSKLNNTKREDRINERARNLESATDELRREFDRNDSWAENKAEVRKCLNIASDLNVTMRNRKFSQATENNWRAVVTELNALARVYGLSSVGGSYR